MADELISKSDKARITRLDNIDSAFVMLFLVNQFHTEQLTAFPKELILAICWEESFFQNIPQLGGPAVGYGQLERDGRRIANQHATNNLSDFTEGSFTAAAILASREKSISAVSHCLAGLFDQLGKSQSAALDGYAGVRQRPANAPIPGRWKDCATALQNVVGGGSFNPIAFEDALRKAREFETSGPVYNHIHSRLWPLVDVLQQLVGQVQIGSQGPQVMIVQDSINRLQNVEPGLSFAPLPLSVDGQFGPKTHSRVKEFQAKNSLVSDGVVGPRTRGAIKDKAQAFPTA
jgi:Putative peptidoglycan binding domain